MRQLWLVSCTLLILGTCARSQSVRKFELRAISPQFWQLFDHDAKLEKVAGGFSFTEGPVWDPAGFLYFSDGPTNKIHRLYPNGKLETVIELGDPDGNTLDRDHHLIDCASVLRAIIRVTPDGGYTVLADHYQGKRFNTPNDVVVGPDDAIYFTDPTLDFTKGEQQDLPFQGVYRIAKDGDVRLLTKDLTQPNGLAFSPDGKRLFVDDTEQRNIRVYDFLSGGRLTNGRIFGEEPGGGEEGVPDGMRFDESGHLFVTGPDGIWVWNSEGHHLGTIVMPEQPANLAWGNKDYRTLYITAKTSVYRLRTLVRGYIPY